MIQCPKCAQQLPDWSQVCQFCQSDLKGVARPKASPQSPNRQSLVGTAKWIWPTYYLISGYYILSGLAKIIVDGMAMNSTQSNAAGEVVSQFSIVGIIVGGLTIIIGIGLAARIEFIRGIVNFFCFLQIFVALLGIGGSLLAGAFIGPAALLGIVWNVLNIVTAGLMIYLIGETD